MTASLFPDMPMMPVRTETAAQRLRARQDGQIALGVRGLRIRPGAETCGTCVHRVLVGGHAKDYPKCEISTRTNGQGTDCLARFPACTGWEAE